MAMKIMLGIVAAALVGLTIAVVVLISTLERQARHEAYLDCMARLGYASDDPRVMQEGLEGLDGLSRAAAQCLD